MLAPACGVSSNYLGNLVAIEDKKRKLALAMGVGHAVWGTGELIWSYGRAEDEFLRFLL